MVDETERGTASKGHDVKLLQEADSALADAAMKLSHEIRNVAAEYSKLHPGEKPSYLGIFLVLAAVAIEIARSLFPKFAFSERMLQIMLVSGLAILVAGSAIEVLMFWIDMKSLRQKEEKLAQLQKETKQRFWGR